MPNSIKNQKLLCPRCTHEEVNMNSSSNDIVESCSENIVLNLSKFEDVTENSIIDQNLLLTKIVIVSKEIEYLDKFSEDKLIVIKNDLKERLSKMDTNYQEKMEIIIGFKEPFFFVNKDGKAHKYMNKCYFMLLFFSCLAVVYREWYNKWTSEKRLYFIKRIQIANETENDKILNNL